MCVGHFITAALLSYLVCKSNLYRGKLYLKSFTTVDLRLLLILILLFIFSTVCHVGNGDNFHHGRVPGLPETKKGADDTGRLHCLLSPRSSSRHKRKLITNLLL